MQLDEHHHVYTATPCCRTSPPRHSRSVLPHVAVPAPLDPRPERWHQCQAVWEALAPPLGHRNLLGSSWKLWCFAWPPGYWQLQKTMQRLLLNLKARQVGIQIFQPCSGGMWADALLQSACPKCQPTGLPQHEDSVGVNKTSYSVKIL